MTQEISIHRSVKHNNIVGFHTYFEDKENIYIILEICNKRVSSINQYITKPLARTFNS